MRKGRKTREEKERKTKFRGLEKIHKMIFRFFLLPNQVNYLSTSRGGVRRIENIYKLSFLLRARCEKIATCIRYGVAMSNLQNGTKL